jgi:hypothetical protein
MATSKVLASVCNDWMTKRGKRGAPPPPPPLSSAQRAEIQEYFDMLDTDHSGTISNSELISAFTEMGMPMSQAEIKAFLSDIDKDKSGEVEIDEFVSLMSLMYQQGTTPGSTGLDLGHTMALFRRKHLLGALMAGGQQRTRLIETHDHMARLAVEEKGRDVRKGKNKFIYAVQRVQRKGMKEVAAASIAAEEKRGGWGRSYRVEKAQNAFFDAAQEFAASSYFFCSSSSRCHRTSSYYSHHSYYYSSYSNHCCCCCHYCIRAGGPIKGHLCISKCQ